MGHSPICENGQMGRANVLRTPRPKKKKKKKKKKNREARPPAGQKKKKKKKQQKAGKKTIGTDNVKLDK